MTSILKKIAPNDFMKGFFAGIGLVLTIIILTVVF